MNGGNDSFTERVCRLIAAIPPGQAATYGGIAAAAGSPRAARQVAWVLRSQSRRRNLPWHRVVSSGGKISIRDPQTAQLQRQLLSDEGLRFDRNGRVLF